VEFFPINQRYTKSNHIWYSLIINEQIFLLGCSNNQIEIYSNNIKSEKIISYKDNLGGITHLIRVSSILIICITRRGYLITFEYRNNLIKQIYNKRLHQWSIRVCKIDSNALLIFTGSDDHSIKITNISNGLCLYTLHKHQAPVNCLSIDPVSYELVL